MESTTIRRDSIATLLREIVQVATDIGQKITRHLEAMRNVSTPPHDSESSASPA